MDGAVEVDSRVGRTVFSLVLPQPVAAEPREREPAAVS